MCKKHAYFLLRCLFCLRLFFGYHINQAESCTNHGEDHFFGFTQTQATNLQAGSCTNLCDERSGAIYVVAH